MNAPVLRTFLLALVLLLASACGGRQAKEPLILPVRMAPPVTNLIASSYAAADALIAQLAPGFPTGTPVIVATLVNINQLESSSPLGRLLSEQIANRFATQGYGVIEVKTRNQLYLKRNEGELILSREIREIAQRQKIQLIISGTYTETPDRVYVNLKVIDWESDRLRAAFDYVLSKDRVVDSLLHPG